MALGAPSHASALLRRLQYAFRDGQNENCPIEQPIECVDTQHC